MGCVDEIVYGDVNYFNYEQYIGKTISVQGNVCLCNLSFRRLPINFVSVDGDFDCSCSNLNTLEGCPEYVRRNFNCYGNQLLTSLKGSPSITNGYFDCSYNKLKNLEGCPQKIDGWINCEFNPLISLKGAPIECSSFMYYSMNEYVTTEMLYMLNERYRKLKVLKNNYYRKLKTQRLNTSFEPNSI